MGSPQQRISPSKESRSVQIRNPKTQENRDPPPAFLQNRILAQVKSSRQINRFQILHGRLCGVNVSRRFTAVRQARNLFCSQPPPASYPLVYGAVGCHSPATTSASPSPGQGGIVIPIAAKGSNPNVLNWK